MANYKRFYSKEYKYIFITIVTNNRAPILIDNIELLRNAFKYSIQKIKYEIYAINILKDHLHLILKINNSKLYPEAIRLMKYWFSIHVNKNQKISSSKQGKREKGIWQRRYWEHTIRNEQDLYKHLDYIHYNSYKHYRIAPKDWRYSSFKKFDEIGFYEKDWCNQKDFNGINELDFE